MGVRGGRARGEEGQLIDQSINQSVNFISFHFISLFDCLVD